MQLGDHLGFAGIVTGLVGVGLALRYPQKRWIGTVFLVLALLLGSGWGVLAYREAHEIVRVPPQTQPLTPQKPPNNPVADAPKSTPKTELPASLGAVFYDKDNLRFWLVDTGDIAAIKPKFTFGLANLSNQYIADYDGKGSKVEPLPIPTKEVDDYVRPHESLSTFIVLNSESKPFVKTGDRLLGEFHVVCLNCDRQRTYWIYWEVGVGGWYYEVPIGKPTNIPFIQSKGWSDAQIDSAADNLAPFNKRVSIYPNLEIMQKATQRH